jgi:hypothetical protein
MVAFFAWDSTDMVEELDVTATLTRTVEKFARKIEQLAIIKEVGILVVLAGMPSSPGPLLIQIRLFLFMTYKASICRNNLQRRKEQLSSRSLVTSKKTLMAFQQLCPVLPSPSKEGLLSTPGMMLNSLSPKSDILTICTDVRNFPSPTEQGL